MTVQYASLRASRILGDLGLLDRAIPADDRKAREQLAKRIIRFLGFRHGRLDSQGWVREMDGTKEVPAILGDMIQEKFTFARRDILGRDLYHRLFTDMAIVEGATGLDLSSEAKLRYGMTCYWQAVKKTAELFKKQYDAHQLRKALELFVEKAEKKTPVPTVADTFSPEQERDEPVQFLLAI